LCDTLTANSSFQKHLGRQSSSSVVVAMARRGKGCRRKGTEYEPGMYWPLFRLEEEIFGELFFEKNNLEFDSSKLSKCMAAAHKKWMTKNGKETDFYMLVVNMYTDIRDALSHSTNKSKMTQESGFPSQNPRRLRSRLPRGPPTRHTPHVTWHTQIHA
jgi:hypothetical protein